MTLRYAPLFLLTMLLMLCVVEGRAQTEGNAQNSLLPEIDPQDIEIRSEFKARFPGLRRQPILGFNPRPRVFQIDPNRIPFMETREEVVANVPVSQLTRPDPPEQNYLNIPDRYSGFLRAGIGSFTTPEAEGFYTHLINTNSLVTGAVNYSSSDGHLDQQASSFRFFNADIEYLTRPSEDLQLDFRLSANSDFNYLAGFDQLASSDTPKKDYTGLSGQVELTKKENELEGLNAALNFDLFSAEQDAFPGLGFGQAEVDEQKGGFSFTKKWTGNRLFETFRVHADAQFGNADITGNESQQWSDISGGITYSRTFNYKTHLKATAGVAYLSDEFDSKVYIEPVVELTHSLNDRMELSGSVYGLSEMNSNRNIHRQNRFSGVINGIRQSYRAGVTGDFSLKTWKGSKLYGGITYELITDYAFYSQNSFFTDPIFIPLIIYNVTYQDADIFKLFAGFNHQLVPEKFWLNAEAYIRSPKLDAGGDIPFEEKTGLSASLSFKPLNQVLIETWTDFVGERENPIPNDNDLNSFLLLNAKAELTVISNFGFYVKVLNILDQEYEVWRGYEERPLQVLGGLTYKF